MPKKSSRDNLICAIKNDLVNLYVYLKQIVLSHPKKIKTIVVIMIVLSVLLIINPQVEVLNSFNFLDVFEYALSTIMFLLLTIIFTPQEDSSCKRFPVEIFGFIYSIIYMFYSAGAFVVATFYASNFLEEDMWIYGYSVTIIAYVICTATLRRFIERDLTKEGITLLGMIMITTLEFMTYYGIGFFSGIKGYNPHAYESNIFGDITNVINQGIFIASQSQILERSAMEIWGYIILNGTDVLTITVVF